MKPTYSISPILRLAACVALLLALVGGEIGHDHGSFGSPDVCATCSATIHSPALPTLGVAVVEQAEPCLRGVDDDTSLYALVVGAPARSRAPPSA